MKPKRQFRKTCLFWVKVCYKNKLDFYKTNLGKLVRSEKILEKEYDQIPHPSLIGLEIVEVNMRYCGHFSDLVAREGGLVTIHWICRKYFHVPVFVFSWFYAMLRMRYISLKMFELKKSIFSEKGLSHRKQNYISVWFLEIKILKTSRRMTQLTHRELIVNSKLKLD